MKATQGEAWFDGLIVGWLVLSVATFVALFFSAAPHNEPIVRGGPFVMNSEEQIRQAFLDYQSGTLF